MVIVGTNLMFKLGIHFFLKSDIFKLHFWKMSQHTCIWVKVMHTMCSKPVDSLMTIYLTVKIKLYNFYFLKLEIPVLNLISWSSSIFHTHLGIYYFPQSMISHQSQLEKIACDYQHLPTFQEVLVHVWCRTQESTLRACFNINVLRCSA